MIPARDEEQLVGDCLRSVLEALDQVDRPAVVVLVAHRCTDATAQIATRLLAGRGTVIAGDSPDVAGARRAGVQEVLGHFAEVDPGRLGCCPPTRTRPSRRTGCARS